MNDSTLEALVRRTLTSVAERAVGEQDEAVMADDARPSRFVVGPGVGTDVHDNARSGSRIDGRPRAHRGGASDLGPSGRRSRLAFRAAAAVVAALMLGAVAFLSASTPVVPAAEGAWSPMAPGPLSPRFAPGSVWTGSELILFGGWDEDGHALADGAAYDPLTDRWRAIPDLPTVAGQAPSPSFAAPPSAVWIDGRAVVVTGVAEAWGWDLLAYDVAADRWTVLEQYRFDQLSSDEIVPLGARPAVHSPAAVAVCQDKIYVIGFRSDLSEMGWATYDLDGRIWSAFHAFSSTQLDAYRLRTTILDDRYLIVLNDHGTIRQGQVGVQIDLASGETVDLPVPPGRPAGSWWSLRLDQGGLAVGRTGDPEGRAATVAYQLDPGGPLWIRTTEPPGSPSDDGPGELVSVGDDHLYLGGLSTPGRSGGLQSRSVALAADADGKAWSPLPRAPIDLNRTGHTVIWTGGETLVWGGAAVDPAGPINRASVPLTDGGRYRPSGR